MSRGGNKKKKLPGLSEAEGEKIGTEQDADGDGEGVRMRGGEARLGGWRRIRTGERLGRGSVDVE